MNPRIYVGALEEATFTMSLTENASFPLSNLSTYIATDLWKSSANTDGQTLKIDFGAARPRNFCIIEGHNFSGMTAVSLQAADDSGYTTNLTTVVTSLVGSNKSPLKFEFTAVSKRYWRILFTTTNSTTPELGQIFIDQKVEFTQSFDFGFRPKNEDFESTVIRTALSGLERSARTFGGRLKFEMGWQNVNDTTLELLRWWTQKVQGNFAPFWYYDELDYSFYVRCGKSFNPATVNAFKVNSIATIQMNSVGVNQNPYTMQTAPMAVDLDGSTEYASKSSPVNLDMNGSERVTDTDDRDFETAGFNWTDEGNHVLSRTTTNPIAGTGSGLIAASAAGDRTTNYIELGAAQFTALESGKKYTIELLANSDTATTTLTLALGTAGQITTSGNLTTTPGSGTKIVLNLIAASSDISVGLRLFTNKAANVRIDSVSITERYPITMLAYMKTSTAANQLIISKSAGLSAPNRAWGLFLLANGRLQFQAAYAGAAQFATTDSGAAFNDGLWHLIGVTIDSSIARYGDGVIVGSAEDFTVVGAVYNSIAFVVGADSIPNFKFTGLEGEIQIIRGYAMTAAQIANIYNTTGILKAYDSANFPGAVVVAHYRWRGTSDTDFLKDETGYNNLTGTALTQVLDQAIGTYRIAEL